MSRISSSAFNNYAISMMNRQTERLYDLQQQIGSGKRIQSASDDPSGAASTENLDAAISRINQYDHNSTLLTQKLSQEETVLENITDILQRLKELNIAANNGTAGDAGRRAYASEATGLYEQLVDNGNSRTSNGDYLFAGGKSRTQPFVETANGIEYRGDQTKNLVKISDSRNIYGPDSGFDLFINVQAEGALSSSRNSANTGTGALNEVRALNNNYNFANGFKLVFSDATNYNVIDIDTNAPLLPSQILDPGQTTTLFGAQFTISGIPNSGDEFSIVPSPSVDMFTTAKNLALVLSEHPEQDTASYNESNYHDQLALSLEQIDEVLTHVSTARSDIGSRMRYIDNTQNENNSIELTLNSIRSETEDTDLAEAISSLQFQQTSLEALRSTYSKVQNMSLFKYL